jgi:NADH:ubiquinone oxidoreductase subunit E
MDATSDLYLCVGSACHQDGVYHLLPILQRLIADHDLQTSVVLRGAFCLGPCTKGVVLKYGEHMFLDLNVSNIESRFENEVLPLLRADARA